MTTHSFQQRYDTLRSLIDQRIASLLRQGNSRELSDGCRYVLLAGGKRVRSVLVLLSAEAVGGTTRHALHAAAAAEIMHNFTLVHDDIMDHAHSRRGQPTVHMKWNVDYALLVGDVLIGLASQSLLRTPTSDLRRMARLLTSGLLEVCEGQALDLKYEDSPSVTLEQYFSMIEKKTARLFSMSAELGGLVGGGTPRQVIALRRFGHYLGRAFQVQDDLLDVVADQRQFGKKIGGDIVEGKKTFLLLSALERARGKEKETLQRIMQRQRDIRKDTVERIATIYARVGAIDAARAYIRHDTRKATTALRTLPQNRATAMLRWFSDYLLTRVS